MHCCHPVQPHDGTQPRSSSRALGEVARMPRTPVSFSTAAGTSTSPAWVTSQAAAGRQRVRECQGSEESDSRCWRPRVPHAAPTGGPTCGGGRRHALPRAEQPDAARGEVEVGVKVLQQLLQRALCRFGASAWGRRRGRPAPSFPVRPAAAAPHSTYARPGCTWDAQLQAHHAQHALHRIVLRVHVLLRVSEVGREAGPQTNGRLASKQARQQRPARAWRQGALCATCYRTPPVQQQPARAAARHAARGRPA